MMTLLHLILPVGISACGIWVLWRTVKKQTRGLGRSIYASPAIGLKKKSQTNLSEAFSGPFASYEQTRLVKLGLGTLAGVGKSSEQAVEPPSFSSHTTQVPVAETASDEVTQEAPIQPIIVLHILAHDGEQFMGYELLQAILSYGFRFGEMDIFHRHQKADGHGKVLFSLARALEPGTFDMSTIGSCCTEGLTLFMCTDGLKQTLAVFDLMLNTAQALADDLNGTLMDEQYAPITTSTISKLRDQLHHATMQSDQAELDLASII